MNASVADTSNDNTRNDHTINTVDRDEFSIICIVENELGNAPTNLRIIDWEINNEKGDWFLGMHVAFFFGANLRLERIEIKSALSRAYAQKVKERYPACKETIDGKFGDCEYIVIHLPKEEAVDVRDAVRALNPERTLGCPSMKTEIKCIDDEFGDRSGATVVARIVRHVKVDHRAGLNESK